MKKRVLIIYYSFTQQTRILIKNFAAGIEEKGAEVVLERLEPVQPYEFPFKTDLRLASVMVRTFLRRRAEIHEISQACYGEWDRIVLAGPTWSYHPSGPVLDFLARFGEGVCRGKEVSVFISCRSYWRLHYWSLRIALKRFGSFPTAPIIYVHPIKEPYRLIGLILQLRGKMIRRENSWFRKHYPGYGHNKSQLEDAYQKGLSVGAEIISKSEDVD